MNSYNGWLIINKALGPSSNDAVRKVQRLFGKKNKVGHAGTLDPLAQGVLPIAIGEATKTVQYLMNAKKEYVFSITWGEERDTGDAEGAVIAKGGVIPLKQDIINILPQFFGVTKQMPPKYSALKINGQPAYKLARSGQEVVLQPRDIIIEELELIEHNVGDGFTSFRVLCGKGTYVRSLAVDIARALFTYGYVSFLKRTMVGGFSINNSINLQDLLDIKDVNEAALHLLPVNFALEDLLSIELSEEQVKLLRQGMRIFLPKYIQNYDLTAQVSLKGILQAIVLINAGECKSIRVFNLF